MHIPGSSSPSSCRAARSCFSCSRGRALANLSMSASPTGRGAGLFVAGVSFSLPRRSACRGLLGGTHQIPPFHFIMMAGRHIHHLVFGILTLLLVGYGWLLRHRHGYRFHFPAGQRLDVRSLRSPRRAHHRRVRHAQPARRLPGAGRTRQHGRSDFVRGVVSHRSVGRAAAFGEAGKQPVESKTSQPN